MTDRAGWDPASSVGLTATEAAAARAVATRTHAAMINDHFAAPLVRALGVDFFTQLAEGDCGTDDGKSGFAMPGMVDWIAVRTRFFDDYFTAAEAADIRQSVILGAGLDSRAYRLNWSPGTVVYEVDQPGVVEFKSATMALLNAHPHADHQLVGVDLRGDWVSALRDSGFDSSVPTAWSAEGLLPYLPPEAQEQLLDNISALSAEGSWFAADTVGDVGELAAQVVSAFAVNDRPNHTRVEIDAAIATSSRPQLDTTDHFRLREWTSTDFSALDLFAAYETPAQPNTENLYRHVRFVTAYRGHGSADLAVAGI